MLGLTVPDAIAFGSLCVAFLAAVAGMWKAERVKADSGSPAQARREALDELTTAVAELAAAIRAATSADVARDQYTDVIRALMRRLDDHDHSNNR